MNGGKERGKGKECEGGTEERKEGEGDAMRGGERRSGKCTYNYTSLASMTVPTPTVNAVVGTLDTSPPKNLALALIVSTARDLILVRETREEPGSLKAICPSGPMPKKYIEYRHFIWFQPVHVLAVYFKFFFLIFSDSPIDRAELKQLLTKAMKARACVVYFQRVHVIMWYVFG